MDDKWLKSVFSRRAAVIGGIQIGALGLLGARLGYLQLGQGERYAQLSDKNRIEYNLIPPLRGKVVDRFGLSLAINRTGYDVVIIREHTDDADTSLRKLTKFIPLTDDEITDCLNRIKTRPRFTPVLVKSGIDWDQLARIESHLDELPGINVQQGYERHYPFADAMAHPIGYVGAVAPEDLSDNPALAHPGVQIGKAGLENLAEAELRGVAGKKQVEVNASGRQIRELSRQSAHHGATCHVTIDGELQAAGYERLSAEKSGAAVVMDADTGAIYAMISYPGFDPNLFANGIGMDTWQGLLSDPAAPLTNKTTSGLYPPGSTFKMISALAGLKKGIMTEATSIHCPGYMDVGDHRFHCWRRGGHGKMDLVDAITQSCDVYFYQLAREIGIDAISDMAGRFGLGQTYDGYIPAQKPGLIPTRTWKRGRFGNAWQPGETIIASIGQGYMQSTPLQLAVMTARLVNGGHMVTPSLIRGFGDDGDLSPPTANETSLNIDPYHLHLIKRGMDRVTGHPRGTAHGYQIKQNNRDMGGKTGTSQVRRISSAERQTGVRDQADLPWKLRNHALFVGYAPVDRPKYVVSVIVEHGGSGAATAAPIARDLLKMTQERKPDRFG